VKRYLVLLMAFVFPLLLFANTWQAYRFEALNREVVALDRRQHDIIEENKRAIAALSVLKSPSRIRAIARDQLDLDRVDLSRIYTIYLESGR
jgi:cell division protein FtsL